METAWLVHTRPDLAYSVATLAQVTEIMFTTEKVRHIKTINKLDKTATSSPNRGLRYVSLDPTTMHLWVYGDGSFANNPDGSSQLGFVILLSDGSGRCVFLSHRSFKSRRRVRSVQGAEVSFVDAFDEAYLLRAQLKELFGREIPLRMLLDSRSLFDVLSRGTLTTERRLVIDLLAAREAYTKGDISDLGNVRSEFNLADCLTKQMDCSSMRHVMTTARINHPVEEWVVRDLNTLAAADAADSIALTGVSNPSNPCSTHEPDSPSPN